MESLNKQQLILLALLVSFVTSIATGIVTVSLMDQAPPAVTQTINRVVEKTIERVVAAPSQPASVITTKETVVVKADDLVIKAIEKNVGQMVRIIEQIGASENKEEGFVGIGLIVSSDGLIVSDFGIAFQKEDAAGALLPEEYLGVFQDGERVSLAVARGDRDAGLIAFKIVAEERGKEKKEPKVFPAPAQFAKAEPKLGQTIVVVGGAESTVVSTGIVANLLRVDSETTEGGAATGTPQRSATTTPAAPSLAGIKTDIAGAELVRGAVLLNLSGEVIGMSAGGGRANAVFVPVQAIERFIATVDAPEEEKGKEAAPKLQ
ncbi:MAG: hypothetical protein Greene041679_23 [Parcubacteria group bacterium Greene0416_79]|nr:MAG: hypothetical protein Greene041679_23 [Parcubacteria group bacterium Greene0416_79]